MTAVKLKINSLAVKFIGYYIAIKHKSPNTVATQMKKIVESN